MNLAERLRSVVRPPAGGPPAAAVLPANADAVAETLGGNWHEAGTSRYLVVERRYGPGHRLGRVAVADSAPGAGGWSHLRLLMGGPGGAADPARLLFFDLETTGLAGGAGTYAFLVGCGWFDGAGFRVRQFLLGSHAAEPGLLDHLAGALRSADGIVTYNGKSFDVSLMETRYLFHRMQTPFAGVPHLDMLHPARRLWREHGDAGASPACRLASIERSQLGHVRDDDVAGFEIPERYFHYVRTGDAGPLHAVLEHNRQDLLSLAMLTAQAVRLLDTGPAGARSAREALGLGRLYERGGLPDRARVSFARATDLPGDAATRGEALRAYAVLCRRERLYEEAAVAWRRLLDLRPCPPQLVHEAAEALAVHHEHRIRDLAAARRFAVQSMALDLSSRRSAAVRYRLERLDRKLRTSAPGISPLF